MNKPTKRDLQSAIEDLLDAARGDETKGNYDPADAYAIAEHYEAMLSRVNRLIERIYPEPK